MAAFFISYSQAMIAARRAGRKTQTRRVVKPQPYIDECGNFCWNGSNFGQDSDGPRSQAIASPVPSSRTNRLHCPYGKPGDTLIVREAAWMWCRKIPNGKTATGRDKFRYEPNPNVSPRYQIDTPGKGSPLLAPITAVGDMCWRLKIPRFLPRWACRSRDEVVSVRVERLQSISEADAIAEGCYQEPAFNNMWTPDGEHYTAAADGPIRAYSELWERINGEGSWSANPWVWVIEFARVQG